MLCICKAHHTTKVGAAQPQPLVNWKIIRLDGMGSQACILREGRGGAANRRRAHFVPGEFRLRDFSGAPRADIRDAQRTGYFTILGAVLFLLCLTTSIAQEPERAIESSTNRKSNVAAVHARRDFETRCASCHGLDGRGGEHAPNISTSPAIRRISERDIYKIIYDGIPAKGMPGFNSLTDQQIKGMVSYLRSLGGHSSWEVVRGNPLAGETLFFGKAACGNCHMLRGKGGFLGTDMTDYAASHTPAEARAVILDPGKFPNSRQGMVSIATREGEHLSGVLRNEDNFSIQLLGEDGTLHMLLKSEIEHSEQTNTPVMPSNYAQRLSQAELGDLLSYLGRASRRREAR